MGAALMHHLLSFFLLLQQAGESAARSASVFSHLAGDWAYTTMAATSMVAEEVAPILGGFAAEQGHLEFLRVVVACTVGSWGAGVALYLLGRWRGHWVRAHLSRFSDTFARAFDAIRGRPWHAAIVSRFAFGMRIFLPIACGLAHVPTVPYVVGTLLSAIAWSFFFTFLGWAFGETAVLVLGHVRRYEDMIAVAITGSIVLAGVILHRRAKERAAARAPGGSKPA
jgi:membrane protein DedA with SNARE-associated domain